MNKKLISMLLVGAAFTACTDDEFVDGYSNNQQVTDGLVQDLILSVSMDADVQSRAAYAGSTEEEGAKSLFSNFYLEPAYDGNDLDLSDNTALKGDMLGFCLTNGANAITNLPFYIAGYNTSDLNAGETAKDSVWVFATQNDQESGYNSLYDLGLDLEKVTPAVADKALIDAAKTSLAATSKDAEMQSKDLDLRKGIVRSNAGVMTGKYVAYFPYDSEFVDPAGVPIKKLGKAIEDKTEAGNGFFAATQAEAIQKADFYNKLFAISQTTLDVNGGTKAGKVSLAPRTGGIFFRLYNTAEVKEKPNREIKRITVETTTPETTDFILEGNVPMNDLSKVVATKTTDLIGVAFIKDSVAAGTTAENAKWVMIPVYPNSTKGVKITLYTTDGQAAVATKQGGPQMGAVKTYKLNIDSLEFKPVTRKIFTANDFLAEMTTAGELELMDDITVTLNADLDKKLNIKGAKTLTINNAGSYGITADSLNLHDAAGSKLVLKGFKNVAKTVTADSIALVNSLISPTAINAAKVEVDANSTITLKEAEITSLINNGTVTVTNADKKNIVVGTFDNKKTATISATGTLTATTFNNNAGATLLTETAGSLDAAKYGKLAATTINNAAKIPAGTNPVTPEVAAAVINNNGILAGTINNAGTITWGTQAIDVTINNTGALTIGNNCKFTGSLTNAGEVTISAEVSGDGGSIANNTNGEINVTGKLYLNTTTLAINAGTVKVDAAGLINGSTNITVAEGADYVKAVVDELNLTSALETEGVYAKFTGVELAPTSDLTIEDSISTAKKIFITTNKVTFAKGITLTGGLESTVALTFNKTADITGDIASVGALTFTGAAALVGDMTLKANAKFSEASTLTGNLKVDGTEVTLTAKNLKITKDVTIAESKLLRMGSNTKVSINGKVINNGTFELEGAAVTCTGIETGKDATWLGQPLY